MARSTIRRYAVVGAGNMGSGIAQKIATEGFPVVLLDREQGFVDRGLATIRRLLDEAVARKIKTEAEVQEILGRIVGTTTWEDLGDVDLVIEAVFEDLEVKRQVFEQLSRVCRPDAILATNTSSFYVADVAKAVVTAPERVIGLHYFYHPAKNRLVEVLGHAGSDPDAVAAAWAAQEAIGKTPIASADAPGFVVNRYFVPWLNEAVRVLEEGLADIPTIEAAAKRAFSIGMGPFELMNVTGVPIAKHAATTLGTELGPFYAPTAALVEQVASGANWVIEGEADPTKLDLVADRLLGVAFMVAGHLVDEGVGTIEDTDLGARVGLRWSMGPFELANQVGIERARCLAGTLAERWGLSLPRCLAEASVDGIPIALVTSGERAGLATVWIQRPDAMNALDPGVVGQLGTAVATARASGRSGIVLGGSGKAFVAGADVKFFVDRLRTDAYPDIEAFTRQGAAVLSGLSGEPQPVVARVHGLSLGGGSELALACDWIAATPKASFGFPETGIGIVPGLGGCHRLARRIGTPLAKHFVYTGFPIDAATAVELGIIDGLAEFDELDAACAALVARGPGHRDRPPSSPPSDRWQAIWTLWSQHSVAEVLQGKVDEAAFPGLEKALARVRTKSAHALALCERLFDLGHDRGIAAALELDLELLAETFAHPDALEGLSSLLERRRPQFQPFAS